MAKKQGIKKGDGGDSEEFKTGKKSCPGKGDIKTDTASVVSAPNVEIKTTTGEGVKSKSELRKERRLTQVCCVVISFLSFFCAKYFAGSSKKS